MLNFCVDLWSLDMHTWQPGQCSNVVMLPACIMGLEARVDSHTRNLVSELDPQKNWKGLGDRLGWKFTEQNDWNL